ncbi:MAG: mannose-1-phosphate guanyltransferase [bacterium]
MKVVIMAGGFGTRLRPLTYNYPKPMIPIVNKPMLEHIIRLLGKHKLTDILAVLYYHPEIIKNYIGDGSGLNVNVSYVDAIEDFGTAGSIKNAQQHLKDSFMVISGDVLTDFDLTKAIKFHKSSKSIATIVLTRVTNPLAYGVVITDKQGKIERFLEKPVWGEVFSDTVNTGIYILEKEALEYIPAGKEFDFSRHLFPLLLQKKLPLYGYVADGYWRDIGNLTEYRLAQLDILSGEVRVDIPGEKLDTVGKDVWVGEGSQIDPSVNFRGGVVIGKGCVIKKGATIENSVIGDNSIVEEDAIVEKSVIWEDVHIGRKAELKENIVGRYTDIRAKAFIQDGAVIAEKCTVGVESRIKANVKMWPNKVVEDGATLSSSLVWGEKWAKHLFGAYGITGLANIEMSPEFAAKLGAAYGSYIGKGNSVVTSRDTHKTSRMINRAIICGLLSSGVDVKDLRTVPMPVLRYTVGKRGEKGGIHTRKSPYDPQLIDIKFCGAGGADLSASNEKSVEQLFFREDFQRVSVEETGELTFPTRVIESYKAHSLDYIDKDSIKGANFKIVIDYAFGDSSIIFPAILGELGCEVIALNANLDSTKITKNAKEFEEALSHLSETVLSLGADAGFLLDTGAEKIFISDEKGNILSDDMALAVMSLLVSRSVGKKGKIAVPVTASSVIEDIAKKSGTKVMRTPVSPRLITEVASKKEVDFIGDNLGGFIFPQFLGAFDGMLAVMKVLELLAKQKISLNKLLGEVPEFTVSREKVPCGWENKGKVMRNLMQLAVQKKMKYESLEGIKVYDGNDWVLLLPDANSPFFHIYAEARVPSKTKSLIERYKDYIIRWQQ